MELDFRQMEDGTQNTEHGWTDRRGSRNSYLDNQFAFLGPNNHREPLKSYDNIIVQFDYLIFIK